MISDSIKRLQDGTDLTRDEMNGIMTEVLSGNTTTRENADFLALLADKGETDDELLGMLDRMQEMSLKIEPKDPGAVIDMCGTGGDGLHTFNVSTAASFVVAAAGGVVAKHGNRSSSGVSGSADIFEYFGYDLDQEPPMVAEILKKHNICFMFAQRFHPAMKHVRDARRQLKRRTAFNLLGPLSNPAGVRNQLVGVSSIEYLERLPAILRKRGARNVIAVRSDDGMDEFSTSAANRVCILRDGKMITDTVDPEEVGLHKSSLYDIRIGTREDAARSFVKVLAGTANRAMTETTALNAAGGLIVADVVKDFGQGVEVALDAIKDGKALRLLKDFVSDTGDATRLEGMM